METRIGVRDVKRSEDVKNSKPLNLLRALYSCKESRGSAESGEQLSEEEASA